MINYIQRDHHRPHVHTREIQLYHLDGSRNYTSPANWLPSSIAYVHLVSLTQDSSEG